MDTETREDRSLGGGESLLDDPSRWLRVAPSIVYTFDHEGVCTMSEGSGLAALGLEPGQMVGVPLLEAYADDARSLTNLRRCLAGETFTSETLVSGRLLETYFQPLTTPRVGPAGGLGVVSDITDRRRHETAAREAAQRVRALVELTTALARDVADTPAMLTTAIRAAATGTSSSGALWLLDASDQRLRIRAYEPLVREGQPLVPTPGLVTFADLELDRGRVDPVARAVLVDLTGPEVSDHVGSPRAAQWLRESGAHSCLRVPLRARGSLIGAIDLVRRHESATFSEGDVDFAVDVAERCALALDNALLLQAQRTALAESLKFKALADSSGDLIAIAGPDGVVQYANERVDELGIVHAGRELRAVLRDVIGAEQLADVERGLAERGRWAAEVTLRVPGGEVIAEAEAFGIQHPETREPLGFVWTAQDVTDLRSAVVAVRAANHDLIRFKSLVEACPEFIAMAAPDGRVLYVNPPGQALVGLPDAVDVTETSIVDYLSEDGLERSVRIEQPAVMERGFWEGESTLRDWRGGPPIPVQIASFLIRDPETDEPYALATVQRDLSDRVAAEEELRALAEQRQQLLTRLTDAQEAERAHIAAEVHDDSVQVLAAVDLRLGLLTRRIQAEAPGLAEYVEPLRETVSEATDRLRALLFDLTPVDLEHGLPAAVREAGREMFDDTETEVEVAADDLSDLSPPSLRVGYRIAREAMFNARKHAQAGRVVIRLRERDGGLWLSVADDGVGITHESISSTAGHLGLSNMQDRAQIAGGAWSIRRRGSGGTEVRAWLPGGRPPEQRGGTPAEEAGPGPRAEHRA